jgi:hypothetical protein
MPTIVRPGQRVLVTKEGVERRSIATFEVKAESTEAEGKVDSARGPPAALCFDNIIGPNCSLIVPS